MIVLTLYNDSIEIFPVESLKHFMCDIFDDYYMHDTIYAFSSEMTLDEEILLYFAFHSKMKSMTLLAQERILGRDGHVDLLSQFSAFYAKSIDTCDRFEYVFNPETKIMYCNRLITFRQNEKYKTLCASFADASELPDYNIDYGKLSPITSHTFDLNFFKFDLADRKKIIERSLYKKRKRFE